MTDPIKALADAARNAMNHWCPTHCDSDHFVCPTLHPGKSLADCTCGAAQEFAEHAELSNALAAYDAAQESQSPSDAEIEAWHKRATEEEFCYNDDCVVVWKKDIDEAIRLMRRARPDAGLLPPGSILPSAPLVPPHDGLLRVAKSVLGDATYFSNLSSLIRNALLDDLRAEVARLEGK